MLSFNSVQGDPTVGAAILAGEVIGGLGSTYMTNETNKEMQQIANEFTREQSKNQIKYNWQQMLDLGLSPLMLFDNGNATGGGAGGGKAVGPAANYATGLIAGLNTVGKILETDARNDIAERRIDQQQDYNDHLFAYLNQKLANENSPNFKQRTYSRDEINDIYDKL